MSSVGTIYYGATSYGTNDDGATDYGTTSYGTTYNGTTYDGTTYDGTTYDGTTCHGSTGRHLVDVRLIPRLRDTLARTEEVLTVGQLATRRGAHARRCPWRVGYHWALPCKGS